MTSLSPWRQNLVSRRGQISITWSIYFYFLHISTRTLVKLAQMLVSINSKINIILLPLLLLIVGPLTLRKKLLWYFNFRVYVCAGIPIIDLFMYRHKQSITFFILLCSIIWVGFFQCLCLVLLKYVTKKGKYLLCFPNNFGKTLEYTNYVFLHIKRSRCKCCCFVFICIEFWNFSRNSNSLLRFVR